MRNSVILVDQIEPDIAAGHGRWQAIVDATVRRFRPIVLTAMAAVLAMIPLSRSAFFGRWRWRLWAAWCLPPREHGILASPLTRGLKLKPMSCNPS